MRRESVEVGGQSLDLIITGPGDHPEDPDPDKAGDKAEVTFSAAEVYGPLANTAKARNPQPRSEDDLLAVLDQDDKAAFLAFKDDGTSNEKWLCGHLSTPGWLAYVHYAKYGEHGPLRESKADILAEAKARDKKALSFTAPPDGVLWG